MLLRDSQKLRELTRQVREWRGPIALDTEYSGPLQVKISKSHKPVINQHLAELTGFSFSMDGRKGYYVPVHHREGNAPYADARELLAAITTRTQPLVFWNAKADVHVIRGAGLQVTAPVLDAMAGAWLLTREGECSLGLKQQAAFRLDMPMATFEETVGNKVQIRELKPEDATPYAVDDSLATYRLYDGFLPKLQSENLTEAFEFEMRFLPILIEMERVGMRLDFDFIASLQAELEPQLKKLMDEWDFLAPGVNPNSGKQLREHFYDGGHWSPEYADVTKKKKVPATNADALEGQVAHLPPGSYGHVCAKTLLDISMVDKILSTYTDTLVANARQYPDGRLHPSYNQMVARTGRLSCSYPNLQNIPVRTELGKRVRQAFLPSEGMVLLSADYSQIEARVLAHLAGPGSLQTAFRNEEDIHDQVAKALGISRYEGKTLNYTMIFGAGPKKVARQLGVSLDKAKDILEQFMELRSDVASVKERIIAAGMRRGYVRTMVGRRRYFDLDRIAKEPYKTRKLLLWAFQRRMVNTPIQGSAADIMKKATVELHGQLPPGLARIVCQVHDENVLEVAPAYLEDAKRLVKHTMESSTTLDVPVIVDVGSGANWAEAK